MSRLYINMLMLVFVGFFLSAQTTDDPEYQVKAAFIFNFTQFVEWPLNAFPKPGTPLVIGILGKDPFGDYLEETVTGENMNGHLLTVQHYKNIEEVKTCHILFISPLEKNKTDQAIIRLKGRFILTVSDGADFIKQGGMIMFITKNNKIQLEINPEAAREANLVISSKLLRIAKVITK